MHRRRTPWALALALGLLLVSSSAAYARTDGATRLAVATITPAPAFTHEQLSAHPERNWVANGGNVQNSRYSPLDDINTTRFVDVLREMSSNTQFIVITHNKLSMEVASRLYGVTMEEKGVSKLVSVELEEVQPEERRTA